MAEQQAVGSAGEMMVFGLIEQADRIGKSALATQKDLAEQIEHLGEVQEWAVKAGVELQKQAAAAIKNLESERTRLQGVGPTLQQNAAWAMRESLREHSDKIEAQISAGMAVPLDQIKQAATQVRQNVREANWVMYVGMLLIGTVLGLFAGYLPMRSSVKALEEHVNQIDSYLAAQQPQTAPVTPESSHTPAHKGKK